MSRNTYRTMSPAEIATLNARTLTQLTILNIPLEFLVDSRTNEPVKVPRLTFDAAIERLGLKLVVADITYPLDADGNPEVDENGEKLKGKVNPPEHDWSCNVTVEGFEDCEETPIGKGKQFFIRTKQAANRGVTPSNVDDISLRLNRWVLNGETMIKDENEDGQNEQHRCLAVVQDKLTGANLAPPEGIYYIPIGGICVEGAGSIDTGKQKSATDDLDSNHELLMPKLPLTMKDFQAGTQDGFGATRVQARHTILREMQGVCKRLALRMTGANIKASKFSGYVSSGNVQAIAEHWEGLDELVNMVQVFVNSINMKQDGKQLRPVKVWEVATAYCCYSLRNSPQLESINSVSEYPFPEIDLQPLKSFLTDLVGACTMNEGPLVAWCGDRVTRERLLDKDESSFAQVMRAIQLHALGQDVTPDINLAKTTGAKIETGKGAKFYHFGGGDRGPLPPKEKKTKASDAE